MMINENFKLKNIYELNFILLSFSLLHVYSINMPALIEGGNCHNAEMAAAIVLETTATIHKLICSFLLWRMKLFVRCVIHLA